MVQYGRVVFDNLRKTIDYLLSAGSFAELWPIMTNVVCGLPQVLSSFLMVREILCQLLSSLELILNANIMDRLSSVASQIAQLRQFWHTRLPKPMSYFGNHVSLMLIDWLTGSLSCMPMEWLA